MKISIAWLFDHISADRASIDPDDLIAKINEITAEVEHSYTIDTDLTHFAMGKVTAIGNDIELDIPEWHQTVSMPKRTDVTQDGWYIVLKNEGAIRWALSTDFGGEKEMVLPAIADGQKGADGSWKKDFETKDTIFIVDNKSITHRPDLWSHRGFAREVAAIFDLKLKPLEDFLQSKTVIPYERHAEKEGAAPYSLSLDAGEAARRFAGYAIHNVTHSSSLLWMIARLSRVDSRAIDAFVDFTNYVMLDIGQPMHAFDADHLPSKSITVRMARNKEKLVLLDGAEIELNEHDIVIADGEKPVSLAGIMGGKHSGVGPTTNALFLESANFDGTIIRRSAQRHKVRSEASARFEKGLDPNQNVDAIARFLKLLIDADIPFDGADAIASLGAMAQSPEITLDHSFIERRLGTTVASNFIEHTLSKLGFKLRQEKIDGGIRYHIVVPTFRALKDVSIKEDIVEEVGRFYGWGNIEPQFPSLKAEPKSSRWLLQTNKIKHLLSYGLSMRELWTYAFFDESYIRDLGWDPKETLQVKDPVSENWYRMLTSLIPNLFKAVSDNANNYDALNFYEWGRTWTVDAGGTESKKLSGIIWRKKEPLPFYECKAQLQQLFEMLGMKVQWQSITDLQFEWQDSGHTANIMLHDTTIGTAGFIDGSFFKKVALGSAFVFELDAGILETFEKPVHRYVPASKFPPMDRDVTVLAPLFLTVQKITALISNVDARITAVQLVDMFQKKEWKDERALTFRYRIQSSDGTLTKAEADAVSGDVHIIIEKAGAEIR